MPIETTYDYISSLNASWPAAADPKSAGDDHLRGVKAVLRASFPNISGPMPVAHDQVASKTDIANAQFSTALPSQANNAGKALVTDGTNAAWQQPYPTQTANAGKFLVTDGTNASWSGVLKATVVRFADGTDATKLAAFDLSGLTTGATWTYLLPNKGGTVALIADLNMPVFHVREEQSGSTSASGAPSVGIWNTRVLNTVRANEISGASLSSNQVTLPAGTYEYEGSASLANGSYHKAQLFNVTDAVVIVNGTTGSANATTPFTSYSLLRGKFTLSSTKTISLRHYVSTSSGLSYGTGTSDTTSPEVYSELKFKKVA
jgi:hypothetical protein